MNGKKTKKDKYQPMNKLKARLSFDDGFAESPLYSIKAFTNEKDKGISMIELIQDNFSISSLDVKEFQQNKFSELTNDSAFVDAAGARTAAVVNSTAGSETDQAPSVAAMKAYADAAGVSTIVEEFTLSGTDISNGYVTLANTPIANTVSASPIGGPVQSPSSDFSLAGTQFNFLGDLSAELGSGDKLLVSYSY